MGFIETMNNLFGLLANGFTNLINFIKDIPSLFNHFYNFLPSPLNTIVVAFIPLFILCIFYKFVRGY